MTTNNDDKLNLKSTGNYSISGHSLTICSNIGLFCQNTRVFFIVIGKKTVQSTSGKKS